MARDDGHRPEEENDAPEPAGTIAPATIQKDGIDTNCLAKITWPSFQTSLDQLISDQRLGTFSSEAGRATYVLETIITYGPTQNSTAKRFVDIARVLNGEEKLHLKLTGEPALAGQGHHLTGAQQRLKRGDVRQADRLADSPELLEIMTDLSEDGRRGLTLLKLQRQLTELLIANPTSNQIIQKIKINVATKFLRRLITMNQHIVHGDARMENIIVQCPDISTRLTELCSNPTTTDEDVEEFLDRISISFIDFDNARPCDDSKTLYTDYHDGTNGANRGLLLLPEKHSSEAGKPKSSSNQKELYQAGAIAISFILDEDSHTRAPGASSIFVTESAKDNFTAPCEEEDPRYASYQQNTQLLSQHLNEVQQQINQVEALGDEARRIVPLLTILTNPEPSEREPSQQVLTDTFGVNEARQILSEELSCNIDLNNSEILAAVEALVYKYLEDANKTIEKQVRHEAEMIELNTGCYLKADIPNVYKGITIPVPRLAVILPTEFLAKASTELLEQLPMDELSPEKGVALAYKYAKAGRTDMRDRLVDGHPELPEVAARELPNREIATLANKLAATGNFKALEKLAQGYVKAKKQDAQGANEETKKLFWAFQALLVFKGYHAGLAHYIPALDSEGEELEATPAQMKADVLARSVAKLFPNPTDEPDLAKCLGNGMINCYQEVESMLQDSEVISYKAFSPKSGEKGTAAKIGLYVALAIFGCILGLVIYLLIKPQAARIAQSALSNMAKHLSPDDKKKKTIAARNDRGRGRGHDGESMFRSRSDSTRSKEPLSVNHRGDSDPIYTWDLDDTDEDDRSDRFDWN